MSLAKVSYATTRRRNHVISSPAGQVLPCFLFFSLFDSSLFQHNLGWHLLCVNTPRKMSVRKFKIATIGAVLSSFLSLCVSAAFEGRLGRPTPAKVETTVGKQPATVTWNGFGG